LSDIADKTEKNPIARQKKSKNFSEKQHFEKK